MDSTSDRIVRQPIARSDITAMAESRFSDMVKGVVDIARGIMALGGELHSDDEAVLISDGSRQSDLWGVNLYPAESGDNWIEFDSMINVRPSQGNRSRGVENELTRQAIRGAVASLVRDA